MIIIILLFAMSLSSFSSAEEISFENLWNKVKEQSPLLARDRYLLNASEITLSRLNQHWLPSLSLGASAFSTNDPASNFFSNLSQRQISSLDFNPSTLNQPGTQFFQSLNLGLDLPLYEGGRKVAALEAQRKILETQRLNQSLNLLNEYVETALNYASLLSYSIAKERLLVLSNRVNEILSRYSIGNQSNPVGYSGLLGLKSLKNRIAGELLVVLSKESSLKENFSEKIKLNSKHWFIRSENTSKFLDRVISLSSEESLSFREQALLKKSEVLEAMKKAEKSRFLPRIGLFANESLSHGARDLGTSFTGGIYLHWSIFSPENSNQISEKEQLQLASYSEFKAAKQSSEIARKTLLQNEESIQQNFKLLLESESLLSEQVKVATRLFQSGSISALQLAEVLNRRVDLILNLMSVEQGLIEIRGKRMNLSSKEIKSL